jgi:hypothetical protein
MSKKRYGKERKLHVLKTWLLELKNNQRINLITLRETDPSHGSYSHQHDILEVKKSYGIKI